MLYTLLLHGVTCLYYVIFLVLYPLAAAVALLLARNNAVRGVIVRLSALIIAAASLFTAFTYFKDGLKLSLENDLIKYGMLLIELGMAIFIIFMGVRRKKYLAVLLVCLQTPAIIWFELTHGNIEVGSDVIIDRFSIIMMLITGIIGSLICVYALSYMKDYHNHHGSVKDRRPLFFSLLFLFLSAMFGLVLSNNLVWMFFFWEVTTLCSFLLIGYTQSKAAVKNSFMALVMNLIGGFGFVAAIIYMGFNFGTIELDKLIELGRAGANVLIPVVLLAIAGLTKAAQMPFSGWLLGAMVAPTPSSALLHSSTMVKAGVFLIIRLAPVLGFNIAGIMVMLVGGITFLFASFIAISQTDAKKVLAYSTIANLGLIVACGGVGTYEAAWAGILLIIFHAIAKSLMFLSVGTVEHNMGSRDIEDMHGLIVKLPEMAIIMTIGIAGMFLAPFGMLISKWAALKAFIDSKNILIILILAFGSAATLFYWTKWLGKLVAVLNRSERLPSRIRKDEWVSLITHAVLTIGVCFAFPLIATYLIEPYLSGVFGTQMVMVISSGNLNIMSLMLGMLLLIPLGLYAFVATSDKKIVTSYMSGVNQGDNRAFVDSFGKSKPLYLTNWYMEKYFGEKRLSIFGIITTAAVIAVIFLMALGGVLQ